MRIYQSCCLAVVASVTLAITSPKASAQVETIDTVPLDVATVYGDEATGLSLISHNADDRIMQLESRLAMLESSAGSKDGNCNQCPIPSRRIATNTLRNAQTYYGFELAILKPHTGSISGNIPAFGASGVLTPTYDYELSPRVYLGRERCDGLGVRATYWQFDHGTNDVGAFGITTGLEIHALDFDVTHRSEFCGSDVLLSAGLRYGDLEADVRSPAFGGEFLHFDSDGWGPTIGATLRRDLGTTAWDIFVGGRASLLLTDSSINIPTVVTANVSDSTMQIWECRIGVERKRQLRCRDAQLVSQFAFEAQNWQSGAIAGLISPNFGLAGPTFRLGLEY